jgi:hypothetical protein
MSKQTFIKNYYANGFHLPSNFNKKSDGLNKHLYYLLIEIMPKLRDVITNIIIPYVGTKFECYGYCPSFKVIEQKKESQIRILRLYDLYLESSKFKKIRFDDCKFCECNFDNVIFENCYIHFCLFQNCSFNGASFINVIFEESLFKSCDFTNCTWNNFTVRESKILDCVNLSADITCKKFIYQRQIFHDSDIIANTDVDYIEYNMRSITTNFNPLLSHYNIKNIKKIYDEEREYLLKWNQ